MVWMKRLLTALVVASAFMPVASYAAKPWIKAESPHFVVYSDTDRQTTEAYARRLEQYRYIINLFYAQPVTEDGQLPKFAMYFLEDRKDLLQIWPTAKENVAGVYMSCSQGQAAFALDFDDQLVERKKITDVVDNTSQTVIFHEYAHHFMFENSDQLYPRWFVEGFADYYGGTRMQGDTIAVGLPALGRDYDLNQGNRVSYEGLLRSTPAALKNDTLGLFYAQSWLLTHWFMATAERQAQLAAYIDAYNHQEDPVEAFERITGVAVKDLKTVLNKYMATMQAEVFRVKDMPAPAIAITDMPPSARDLLLMDAAARVCIHRGTTADNLKYAETARTLAARWPNDDYAALAVARVDVVIGDESKAVLWLTAYTAAHPDDADAVSLLGEAYYLMSIHNKILPGETKASQMKKARTWLFQAYKLNPLHAGTLCYLALAQEDLPGYPNELALNAITQANILAPAVSDYTFIAARMLILKDRLADARGMLQSLASNPHSGGSAKWAADIIAAIDAKKTKEEILKLFDTPAPAGSA